MPKRVLIDLVGQKFGKLTVIRRNNSNPKAIQAEWDCECECGAITVRRGRDLRTRPNQACRSCHKVVFTADDKKIYRAWASIKSRTTNPNHQTYKYYGARGITMHKPWADDFLAFKAYIGNPPAGVHRASIDRIDNDGNYEPGNIRWATPRQQSNNRSNNVNITWKKKTQTAAEWAREFGLEPSYLHQLLRLHPLRTAMNLAIIKSNEIALKSAQQAR